MATHSCVLAWRIPGMGEPGGLPSMGSYRVGHDWSDVTAFIGRTDAEAWNSSTLATWCEELTHWKRPWFWERLKAGGEGDNRGLGGCMASLTRWTRIWVSSGSWWWTGRPGVLQSMGLQSRTQLRDWTELNIMYVYESESCSVMSDPLQPLDLYNPWNSPGQNTEVGNLSLLQGIFPTQGLNPGLPHWKWSLYQLSHKGSPRILKWVVYPFSSRSFQPMNRTGVSCVAGGFFTNWAIREALKEWSALSEVQTQDLQIETDMLPPVLRGQTCILYVHYSINNIIEVKTQCDLQHPGYILWKKTHSIPAL